MFSFFRKRKQHDRAAGVYLHNDVLILNALNRLPGGGLFSTMPVIRLPISTSKSDIGQALKKTLDSYRANVEIPIDRKNHEKLLLKEMGFKSWSALHTSSARSCWISESSAKITFTPLRNGGNKGDKKGFQPFGANEIAVLIKCEDSELGDALLQALDASC